LARRLGLCPIIYTYTDAGLVRQLGLCPIIYT
jgi:hypothetical protein